MQHAEPVPETDMHKPLELVFYLPMHAVRKESSTTTKIRAVFDASAKSSTCISCYSSAPLFTLLMDVLLRFWGHCIAVTTDVSRMYRAVLLAESDRDLHRFVWRDDMSKNLQDYRMTRVTFGVHLLRTCA